MTMTGDDLRAATVWATNLLVPLAGRDWTVPCGDTEYTCRRTLNHLADCMLFYAGALATRATRWAPDIRHGAPDETSVPQLLRAFEGAATILAVVTDEADASVRAHHPAGMPDPEGFAAMGCDEVLVHAYEIATSVGAPPAEVPDELAARVVARLFPWAPNGFGGLETLLWCNGRIALGPHKRQGPDWSWQCAPLAEWDGTVKKWRPRG